MDLLPKSHSEFTSKDYWERFFRKRGPKSFEWYGEYNDLCGILHKYMKASEKILVTGCGNSRLSADLYDIGYHTITNIDISDTVISQMNQQNQKERPEMRFLKMDVTKLEFEEGSFGVVFDKGTLDALMPDSEEATMSTVNAMFGEIDRMLRLGGRYMCVTLAQSHILQHILHHFHDLGWMIRICRAPEQVNDESKDFHMPVFVIICTKFKKMPNMKPITEFCNFDETIERMDGIEQLQKSVEALQQYGLVRQQLGTKNQMDEQISLDLYCASSVTPRYTIFVVNNPKRTKNKFAIFIVPEGRECEWLFGSPEGQRVLCENAGHERLAIVTLHRDHQYTDGLDGIKAELSTKVMELAPPNLNNKQVPFLTIGQDINTRVIRHRGTSHYSGDFVIEDVDVDVTSLRRLIFLNNPSVIQSEIRLSKPGGKSKGGKRPDPESLTLEYYKTLVAGLTFLQDMSTLIDNQVDVLLIGLGGGCVAKYLHGHFQNIQLEIVELDPEIVTVATNWFGFTEDSRSKVTVADGLQHVADLVKQGVKKHMVILDVDSKELAHGMSCPSKAFVQTDFLRNVDHILDTRGVMVLNIVCRNKDLKESVISNFKSVYPTIYSQSSNENVGETLYAFSSARDRTHDSVMPGTLPNDVKKHIFQLQDIIKCQGHKSKVKVPDVLQVARSLDNLKML